MQRFIVIGGPSIRWRIKVSAPKYLKLKSLPGYRFLNPYKYGKAYLKNDCVAGMDGTLIGEQFQLYTNGIILERINENNGEKEVEFLFSNLSNLLRYLKYTSKQFNLKSDGSVSIIYRTDNIRPALSNSILETDQMMIRGDYYFSMATWDHLKEADKLCSKSFTIPVFEDILLDALDGRTNHEYRKAILYSAIAVESMLANLYDEEYKKLIRSNLKNNRFRMISRNGSTTTDPIFKALSDKTDFRKLLHEIPLYLKNKSLLIEEEQLYADTLKLYTTRNKIVHWGTPLNPNFDQMLEINEAGANLAVQIALKLFTWMGIDKFNQLDNLNLVELKKT